MTRAGFTLLEMMIVVVLIGILAAIALPGFGKTRERAYWQDAGQALLSIYAGERAYFLLNDAYRTVASNGTMDDWRKINTDNPNIGSIPVTYNVAAAGSGSSSTFTATAVRNGGPCDNQSRTVDQNRSLTAGTCWAACGC